MTTRNYLILLSVLLIMYLNTGCSNGKSVNPILANDQMPENQTVSLDHGPGGMMIDAYTVNLDSSSKHADVQPFRDLSAIGDPFLVGITQGGPAGRWFKIAGVELVRHDDTEMIDIIRLKAEFEHPFSIATRPDLCGWDLKAIVVYQNPAPFEFTKYEKSINPPILENAFGATAEWDKESDKVYPTDADLHEFVILSEDNRVIDPFDFSNPQGWNVFHPGMTAKGDLDIRVQSGSSISFMIFLTMGYEISATWDITYNDPDGPGSRTNPVYNPPNGNARAPWKIEIEETGNGMQDEYGSETSYDVRIWDWQHAIPASTSRVKQISLYIPGVTLNEEVQSSFLGSGRENDPIHTTITIENDYNAPEGFYPGLVAAKDNLDGISGTVDGIKTNWITKFALSEFSTYKFFWHEIEHYDPVNTSLFDVALLEFDKIRNDLYWDRTDDSLWKATDTQFMFPLKAPSKMPDFDYYHRDPMNFPGYVDDFTEDLEIASQNRDYSGMMKAISKRLGYSYGNLNYYYEDSSSPLLDAIASLHITLEDPLSSAERTEIADDAMDIPMSVQIMAAKCLYAIELAWILNEEAWEPFDANIRDTLFAGGYVYYNVIQNMDFGKFTKAGAEILAAMEDIRPDIESFTDIGDYGFSWVTPIGTVVVNGNSDDNYSGDNYALLIDTGGNDDYQGKVAGISSQTNTVSVAIDFTGDDTYGSNSQQISQGAGYMGIAVNWDVEGVDVYRGGGYNQGSAYYGCGILIDSSGDDEYYGDFYAQGAGNWGGTGLLLDESGSDRYYSFYASQAFAYTRGSGTLLDLAGDDDYIADDVDIRYPSGQTDEHNQSLSQAAGFGWRSDPNFLAGGIATLLDFGGSDEYSCGVFGQSTAFMFSTSILKDYGSENDTFHGVWYVQSGNAHMGVSYFFNEGGNDEYTCTMNVGMGGAHDFSHAWFYEMAGDDVYTAPGISIGGGNEVGIGIFLDYDGVDIYHCTAVSSMGGGNRSSGRNRDSYGIFVDDGGDNDTYDKSICGNNTSWHDGSIGGGADGDSL